jgi:hypothetical protein
MTPAMSSKDQKPGRYRETENRDKRIPKSNAIKIAVRGFTEDCLRFEKISE